MGFGSVDERLGRRLLERGWLDMAEKVFTRQARSGATESVRRRGERGLIEILKERALRVAEPARKKELFDKAVTRFRDFLKRADDPKARFHLAELLKVRALDLVSAQAREGGQGWRKEGVSSFREAISLMTRTVKDLQEEAEKRGGVEKLAPDHLRLLQRASFYRAELHFAMSALFPRAAPERVQFLRDALHAFGEYVWDWEGYVSAYHAYIYLGRCCLALGDFEGALENYRVVFDIKDQGRGLERVVEGLSKTAWFRILEALNRAGKHKLALQKARAGRKAFPKLWDPGSPAFEQGLLGLLEEAKAHGGQGDYVSAVEVALALMKTSGEAARKGMDLLALWTSRAPSVTVEVYLLQGKGLLARGEYVGAREAFQEAVRRLHGEEACIGADVWHGMGLAYKGEGRSMEAALAFEEGERLCRRAPQSAEDNLGASCAWGAYISYRRAFRAGLGAPAGERYRSWRHVLSTRYAKSPFARNLAFFAGQELLAQGRFEEAIALFGHVPSDSAYGGHAQVRLGVCCLGLFERKAKAHGGSAGRDGIDKTRQDLLTRAETVLTAHLVRTETNPGGAGRESEALACLTLGRVHAWRKDTQRMLKVLDDFENRFPASGSLMLAASGLRLGAYLENGNAEAMEGMLRVIVRVEKDVRSGPERPSSLAACRKAGRFFRRRADRAKRPEMVEDCRSRAWDYLSRALEYDDDVTAAELNEAGAAAVAVGRHSEALKIFERLDRRFGPKLSPGQRSHLSLARGGCFLGLKRWAEAEAVFEEMLRSAWSRRIARLLLRACEGRGMALAARGDSRGSHQSYNRALAVCVRLLKKAKPYSSTWWRAQIQAWRLLCRQGRFDPVVRQITRARLQYPQLGGGELGSEAKELLRKARLNRRPEAQD
jgi:tetratricopeptide (TPR) repeat protein